MQTITNFYLDRYAFQPQAIADASADNLGIVVVIPCCNEPLLLRSLESLHQCVLPEQDTEVIVVLNASEKSPPEVQQQNTETYAEAVAWIRTRQTERLRFHLLQHNRLPAKHAGVGLARKIGMDEAVRRLEWSGKNGIIACFDADSTCDPNYLQALETHFFEQHPQTPACAVYYEHPLDGENAAGIAQYELHLRYYVAMQRWAGFPHAYQTIGSAMAVRSDCYQKQGGMNRRKAGEDFYFLHKVIPLGGFTELNTTRIIPSPRLSDRVPFGTGKAMHDWLQTENRCIYTYHPDTFTGLQALCKQAGALYDQPVASVINTLPEPIQAFCRKNNMLDAVKNARDHTASPPTFLHRFYQWFNGFRVMKYAHFCRDQYYPNLPVATAVRTLFERAGIPLEDTAKAALLRWRQVDRNGT